MPVYEYICPDCRSQFELLRAMKEADSLAACPNCASEAVRKLSRFAMKRAARTDEAASQPLYTHSKHPKGCSCC